MSLSLSLSVHNSGKEKLCLLSFLNLSQIEKPREMIREFAKNRVRVPSFLKSAKLNFTELEINSLVLMGFS